MHTRFAVLAGTIMMGTMLIAGAARAQSDATCGGSVPCAKGVPSAAAGGQGGSAPAELRKTPMDSPVATGAGGDSTGGSKGGSDATK